MRPCASRFFFFFNTPKYTKEVTLEAMSSCIISIQTKDLLPSDLACLVLYRGVQSERHVKRKLYLYTYRVTRTKATEQNTFPYNDAKISVRPLQSHHAQQAQATNKLPVIESTAVQPHPSKSATATSNDH